MIKLAKCNKAVPEANLYNLHKRLHRYDPLKLASFDAIVYLPSPSSSVTFENTDLMEPL